jgi:hypothetical protein
MAMRSDSPSMIQALGVHRNLIARMQANAKVGLLLPLELKVPLSWPVGGKLPFMEAMKELGYEPIECKRSEEGGGNYIACNIEPLKYLCQFDSPNDLFSRPYVPISEKVGMDKIFEKMGYLTDQ